MQTKSLFGLRAMVLTGGTLIASALLAISPAQESETHASQVETACAAELDRSMSTGSPVVGSAGALGGSNATWIITVQPLSETCQSEILKIGLFSEGSLVDASDGAPLTTSAGSTSFFKVRSHASGEPISWRANDFGCKYKPSDLDVVVLDGSDVIIRKKLWLREASAPTLPLCEHHSEISLTAIN